MSDPLDKMAENARDLGLDYEPAQQQKPDAMGCKCSVCGEWQRWTESGMTCKNGHGGAPGINQRLYTSPQPAQRKSLTDEQWDEIANITGSIITRLDKDAIEKVLDIKENT